ncbi:MAG: hypothetical protein R3E79_52805 [Caldilineaceae bacterium]
MFNQSRTHHGYRILLTILLMSISLLGSISLSAAPVHAGNFVPLKGRFAGVGADFSGNFTHIGKFQGVVDLEASTAVWTAANGDTITNQTTSFVLGEEVTPGVFRYEQTLVITGGTGRFANATGSATATGLINVVTGAYDGVLTGTISRPNGG